MNKLNSAGICILCGENTLGYRKRKYCNKCLDQINYENHKKYYARKKKTI